MAVIKAMGGSSSRGSCNDRLDYITKEEKTEEKLIFTKDCSEDNFKKDFEETKQIWDKTEGRQYFHMVQSFEKEDYITLEKAHEIGKKFIEDNPQMKDYQVVMATHKDKDHIHNHFIVNSVGMDTGEKFQMYKADLKQCKELSNEICREYGFREIDIERTQSKELEKAESVRYSLSEKALMEQGKPVWKDELREILDYASSKSKNFEEFKEIINSNGVEISRGEEEGKKSITFDFQDKKCRGNKLDEKYANRENIEKTIELEREKELEREPLNELKELSKEFGLEEQKEEPSKEQNALKELLESFEEPKQQEKEINYSRYDDFER